MGLIDRILTSGKTLAALIFAGFALFAAGGYLLIEHAAHESVEREAERSARSWADYVGAHLERIEAIAAGTPLTAEERTFLEEMRQFGDVFRFKLFDGSGRLMILSDDLKDSALRFGDLGDHNPKAAAVLATGQPFTEAEDGTAKADRPDVYVESYVPVVRHGETVGIVEVYVDQTRQAAQIRSEFLEFGLLIGLLTFSALLLPVLVLVHAAQRLRTQKADLEIERDRAKASERAKAEFLANMSHEIRTPLNGVLGMTGLLLDSPLADEQRQFTETIMKSGEALLTLLNDILDFSKIEAGKLELEATDFEVVSLVDSTVELFAHQAHAKGLELPTFIATDVPEVLHGDEGRIRQVLLNLISNAIKFTDEGGVAVEVSVAVEQDENGAMHLRFDVADTGIGIPEAMRATIFEQFTQVENSSTRKYGGSGLGLAISQRLIHLMGGEIGVEPRDEGGSLFWFTIPFDRQPDAQLWARGLISQIEGSKILVVDDNAINRLVFERQLVALGAQVTLAVSVDSAVRKVSAASAAGVRFDVAIVDHMMPGTDGLDFLPLVRDEPSMEACRTVLSSSSGLFNTDAAARKHGFDAALPKPVRPGALTACFAGLQAQPAVPQQAVPHDTAMPEADTPVPAQPAATARTENQPAAARILVGEDNATNQKLIVALLKHRGYTVDVAGNGLEVIEALRHLPYDLVLMDVQMPELDGLEACRRIRALSTDYAGIPIIGVTAYAMKGDKEQVLAAGMNDYLAKPIDKVALYEKINALLGRPADAPADAPGDARALQERLAASS